MVGIGGIGMSSIAEVLLSRGFKVSGSDLELSEVTDHLESLGAIISEGHSAIQLMDADVVVHSSAINPDENAETIAAQQRRIPVIRRDEMLGELMRMKYGVGIAGTHGKTTTTTMTGMIANGAGLDPTIIVGGKVASFGSNAVSGEGDLIIVEADEYDRTFLRLTPVMAVITNIDEDHLDIYKDIEDIKGAFTEFANSVPFFGRVIVNVDDPNVRDILSAIDRKVVTFGLSRLAAVRAVNINYQGLTTKFGVTLHSQNIGEFSISGAPGEHNVMNALASIAVGLELDIPCDSIVKSLSEYSGVDRRFEVKFNKGGMVLINDYAHHPSEIEATLRAASQNWSKHRLIVVFQPHLYSRTEQFLEQFASSFANADVLIVTEIYAAREQARNDISGASIAKLASEYGHDDVHYVPSKDDLPEYVSKLVRAGDMIIVMGAGDIWRICDPLSAKLEMNTNIDA